MPVFIKFKEIGESGELCHDFEFEISNVDLLADYIVQIIQAHHQHVFNVLKGLSDKISPANLYKDAILQQIRKLESRNKDEVTMYKVDGLLFQIISWIVLVKIHKDDNFIIRAPHLQLADHGFDGLAIKLTDQNKIDKIIITEDKCTENDRSTIKQQVFPEFQLLEQAERDFDISSVVGSLLATSSIPIDYNSELDVMDYTKRQYRISITRQASHNDIKKRIKLFNGYDEVVKGQIDRRHASTIFFEQGERKFMERLNTIVIAKLKTLINV
ncbi:MAG: hypothetical protein J1F67_05930 [Muribaculaceae bacterium]|nr:hypothetical protein [Muribaculaceae bacterium]